MRNQIDITDPMFFNRSAIIYYEHPDLIRTDITDVTRLIIEHQSEINQVIRNKNFVFINIWQLYDMTEVALNEAIKDLNKIYPYYSNVPIANIKKLYSTIIFRTVMVANRKPRIIGIRQYMKMMKDYFEISNDVERGFIKIDIVDDSEKNKVKFINYESIKENLFKWFENSTNISAYHHKSDDELKANLQETFISISTINDTTYLLSYISELISNSIKHGNRENIINNLESYSILQKRLSLSKLEVVRKTDRYGFDYVLSDYNPPDGIVIKLEQVLETLYILFLIKHPEGLTMNEIKEKQPELDRIYSKISNYNIESDNISTFKNKEINAIISKIKKAFKKNFQNQHLVSYYIIAKEPNKSKYKIKLSPDLIKKDLLRGL